MQTNAILHGQTAPNSCKQQPLVSDQLWEQRMRKFFILALLTALLAPTLALSGGKKYSGKALAGDYKVSWGSLGRSAKSRQGLTPLVFFFTHANPSRPNNISESDWEREAQRLQTSVWTLKNVLLKGEVYKTRNGNLAGCTYMAIQKGYCGKKIGLSVEQRAHIAQSILARHKACQWVGFDPTYNARLSHQAGAANMSLHVQAKCR